VWGSRAANGALVINTKRGEAGPPSVSYTFKGSVSKHPSPIPLSSGDQYSTLIMEEFYNAERVVAANPSSEQFQYDPNNPYVFNNFNKNSDWIESITQLGYYQDHNVQIRGGGEKARYLASLGYFNQE